MPQPYSEMEESRSVTPRVNRLYFESPRASSFLGLRLVKARHKNLVPLLSGVKPDPMVGSDRYTEPIPVKCPVGILQNMVNPSLAPTQPEGSELPTFSYGGEGIPHVLKQYRFSPFGYIFPIREVINSIHPRDSYMHHWPGSPLTQVMA